MAYSDKAYGLQPQAVRKDFRHFRYFRGTKKLSICMSKQCPTERTEITERLRIIEAKISVLSNLKHHVIWSVQSKSRDREHQALERTRMPMRATSHSSGSYPLLLVVLLILAKKTMLYTRRFYIRPP